MACPAGDSALLLTIGQYMTDESMQGRLWGITTRLRETALRGIEDIVPAYQSVFVRYDPLLLTLAEACRMIGRTLDSTSPDQASQVQKQWDHIIEIPVCYGGEYGPDLDGVARHCGLSPAEVIAQHRGALYRVLFLGFTPGFPFLSGLPASLYTPRLATPRPHVPAGSVGIAGGQTGFYPLASPGGWRLIGRTPLRLFDPIYPTQFAYAPGDWIRFISVDTAEFDRLTAMPTGHS